jgi:hypothetical protein
MFPALTIGIVISCESVGRMMAKKSARCSDAARQFTSTVLDQASFTMLSRVFLLRLSSSQMLVGRSVGPLATSISLHQMLLISMQKKPVYNQESCALSI